MGAIERHHPLFARLYARLSLAAEEAGGNEHRERLLTGLAGEVIEVGCGNGLNFAHYPTGVTSVTAVEPEPYLRAIAMESARKSSTDIRVVEGRAERLPALDERFDAAVVSLVLCSVKDPSLALAEIARVLRPGGELRFYEHVASNTQPLRSIQHLASPLWQLVGGGCHPDRDTQGLITTNGFAIVSIDHFNFRPGPRFPIELVEPHILGVALRRPTS